MHTSLEIVASITVQLWSLPHGAFDPHHSTAKIASSAHQSGLVASRVTRAKMMLITMQTSATIFPVPKVTCPSRIQQVAVRPSYLASFVLAQVEGRHQQGDGCRLASRVALSGGGPKMLIGLEGADIF